MFGKQHDTDGGGYLMSPLIGNDYDLLNAVSKLAGHLFRLIPIGTVEYHGKFIAAQPADYSPDYLPRLRADRQLPPTGCLPVDGHSTR